jgi:hypothetical protein
VVPDDLPDQTPSADTETVPLPSPDAFQALYLDALNNRNAAQAGGLYDPSAIQVWADQIRRDNAAIQAGFTAFFASLLAGTVFTIASAKVKDDLHTYTWKAGPLAGETILTIKDGKIVLDYTFIF